MLLFIYNSTSHVTRFPLISLLALGRQAKTRYPALRRTRETGRRGHLRPHALNLRQGTEWHTGERSLETGATESGLVYESMVLAGLNVLGAVVKLHSRG